MNVRADVLIIGGGGAGARAAIEASVNNTSLNVELLNQWSGWKKRINQQTKVVQS